MELQEVRKLMKNDIWALEVLDRIEEINENCSELYKERKEIIERYTLKTNIQRFFNIMFLLLIICFIVFVDYRYCSLIILYVIYMGLFSIYKINYDLDFHLESNEEKWRKNELNYEDEVKLRYHISSIPVKKYTYSPLVRYNILTLPDGSFVKVATEYTDELKSKKYLLANIEVVKLIDNYENYFRYSWKFRNRPELKYSFETYRKEDWYLINSEDDRDVISLDSIAIQ